MIKLGFIVEGDMEATVIRALVQRIAPPKTEVAFVRAGGKIGIYSSSPTVGILRQNGYEHVFILFDADSADPESVGEQQAQLENMLATRGLNREATICPIVPRIEAWLLAGMPDQAAEVVDPKKAFNELRDSGKIPRDFRRIAKKLDLDVLRSRNSSFAAFAQQIEHLCASGVSR